MGEKLFAMPWDALTLDTENKCLVLNVNKESLKDAPDSIRINGLIWLIAAGPSKFILIMEPSRTRTAPRV